MKPIDLEEAEVFLRGVAYLESKSSSYQWWARIKHRYPDYRWDGERIVKINGIKKSTSD